MFAFYDNLLHKLKVPNHKKVINLIVQNKLLFYKKYAKNITQLNYLNQIGGTKQITFTFDKYTFHIYEDNEDDRLTYSIYNNDNDKDDPCVLLFIPLYENENYVHIETISSHNNCTVKGLPKTQKGSLLLHATLNFIDTIKKKYKLKHIQLLDNSFFNCKLTNVNIELSSMLMLVRGDTWYGKYGFVPYDEINKKMDLEKYIQYKMNQKLVQIIKIGCTNLKNHLVKAVRHAKIIPGKYKNIEQLVESHQNDTIQHFFASFLKKYDITCDVFSLFYKDFMEEVGLYNLHNISYYKLLN